MRKILEYLGMTFDYKTKDNVKISMYDYIHKMLAESPLDMNGIAKPQWQNIYSI